MFEELDDLLDGSSPRAAGRSDASTPRLKEGERRIVAILFADVEGFTALSERLDPEQVHSLLDKILKLLTRCVERYDGYVDKYEGDKIMALFGARQASERDTERAIRAGFEMLAGIEQVNERLERLPAMKGTRLALRVGVHAGLVTTGRVGAERAGDFTAYGDAVNLASRMETLAPAGAILVPEETMRLAERTIEFEFHGEVPVKGKALPVRTYVARGRRRSDATQAFRRSAFVGRDREMAALMKFREELKESIGVDSPDARIRILGINGPPGMGKSRLVRQFIETLGSDANRNVLEGFAPSLDPTPYCAFSSMLSHRLEIEPTDSTEQIRSRLDRSLPEIGSDLEISRAGLERLLGIAPPQNAASEFDADPNRKGQADRTAIQSAVRAFIESEADRANAAGEPLFVVIEDAQWMDGASADTLDTLLLTLNLDRRRASKAPRAIALILVYRPEYEPSQGIRVDAKFDEIMPRPLGPSDAELLIRSGIGEINIPASVTQLLMERSAGNPFYIEEWVALIRDRDSEAGAEYPVPPTLQALILTRIDRLDAPVKLLLQKAAVIGRSFALRLLEDVERRFESGSEVSTRVLNLAEQDFVHRALGDDADDLYLFKHIVTQQVAYETLLIQNRRTIHRVIGEAIEASFEDRLWEHSYELARHFEEAEVFEKAALYAFWSGARAMQAWEYERAVAYYEKARAHQEGLPVSVEAPEVLLGLAEANSRLGRREEARGFFDRAIPAMDQIEDPVRRGHARMRMASFFKAEGRINDALAGYDDAVKEFRECGDRTALAEALYWSASVRWTDISDREGSIPILEEILAMDGDVPASALRPYVLSSLGNCLWGLGKFDESIRTFRDALRLAEEKGDHQAIAESLQGLSGPLGSKMHYGEQLQVARRALEIAEEVGEKYGILWAKHALGKALFHNRLDDEAARVWNEAIEMSISAADRYAECWCRTDLSRVLTRTGRLDEARACTEITARLAEEIGHDDLRFWALIQRGNIDDAAAGGGPSPVSAIEAYEEALRLSGNFEDKLSTRHALNFLSRSYQSRKDPVKVLEIEERVLAISREIGNPHWIASGLSYMVRTYEDLDRHEDAARCREESLTTAEATGDEILLADVKQRIETGKGISAFT